MDEIENKFNLFMNILLEWNEKINLTSIIDKKEIKEKHFEDSLTILKYIKNNDKIIDVGTGAGFPGIPLKIKNNSLNITLLDSLNKRINFLNEVIKLLNLENIETIHGRAEDIAQNNLYREKYNIAVSRAVAPLNILLEYLLPFVKIGGMVICMKGPNYQEELNNSKNAIKILGGELINIEKINFNNMERNIILLKKIKTTNKIYPRKSGTPERKPL